jgi:hypothetical protein
MRKAFPVLGKVPRLGAIERTRQNDMPVIPEVYLRSLRFLSQEMIIKPSTADRVASFKPSPLSLMCHGMSFTVSMFYQDVTLTRPVMASAIQHLANEAPLLAGRIESYSGHIVTRLSDHFITCKSGPKDDERCGFPFRYDQRESETVQQAVDSIWANRLPLRLNQRRPMCHAVEPVTINTGKDDELTQIDVVRYADGTVVNLHISHILADAGRAIKILERLSIIYEALENNRSIPPGSITCDTWFDKAKQAKEHTDNTVDSSPLSALQLRPSDILQAPKSIFNYLTSTFVPVYLFVPRNYVENMHQQAQNQMHCTGTSLSKLDIVQALVITLIRHVRSGMEPNPVAIINMDLSMLQPRDPGVAPDTLGNSSDFLKIQHPFHPDDVMQNAIAIRRELESYRANSKSNIQASIERTSKMSSLPKSAVHAAFMLHGAREKLASCSAVASFSTDTIRFGKKRPGFYFINSYPGFDWWCIVQRVKQGPLWDKGDGWLLQMHIPHDKERHVVDHADKILPAGAIVR